MVQLWECMSGSNDFAGLTPQDMPDMMAGMFNTDGESKKWQKIPLIVPTFYKGKKKQPPLADIAWLTPGAIVLNSKASAVLRTFLLKFGELLEMSCAGEINYFYNVTNVISCIDFDGSEKTPSGQSVRQAAFFSHAIPQDTQIFKDPLTAGSRIYLTQAAKDALEKLIAENGLTGLRFFEAGKKF
jgi:hypothetical protein